jgi:hypothetical protein
VFPVFASFIAEPFFICIGLYQPLNWEHIYSFPIYIVIYLLANYISKREGKNRLIITLHHSYVSKSMWWRKRLLGWVYTQPLPVEML